MKVLRRLLVRSLRRFLLWIDPAFEERPPESLLVCPPPMEEDRDRVPYCRCCCRFHEGDCPVSLN